MELWIAPWVSCIIPVPELLLLLRKMSCGEAVRYSTVLRISRWRWRAILGHHSGRERGMRRSGENGFGNIILCKDHALTCSFKHRTGIVPVSRDTAWIFDLFLFLILFQQKDKPRGFFLIFNSLFCYGAMLFE